METVMSDELKGHCWHCAAGLTRLDYGRESACPGCDKPTHCCRNCRLYAPGRPNECMEPQVERVIDKARSNFCEWFEPAMDPLAGDAGADLDALRADAESLFRPR